MKYIEVRHSRRSGLCFPGETPYGRVCPCRCACAPNAPNWQSPGWTLHLARHCITFGNWLCVCMCILRVHVHFACAFCVCMCISRVHFYFACAILKHAAIAIIALTSSPKSEYGRMLLFIPFIHIAGISLEKEQTSIN